MTRLEPIGEPVALADGIAVDWRGAAALSASSMGSIVYRSGPIDQHRSLTWFDRSGNELQTVVDRDPAYPVNPALSPDEHSLLFSRSVEGNTDVWRLDLERKSLSRLTTDPGPEIVPVWSPNGREILYSKAVGSGFILVRKPIISGAPEVHIPTKVQRAIAADWSRDGRFILFRTNDTPENGWDVWALPVGEGGEPFPVLQTRFDERGAQTAPDAPWIAYESNESGRYEIYVQPFPEPGEKQSVSTQGGTQPRWRTDGGELFYVAADGKLMSVTVRLPRSPGQRIELGAPVPLFTTRVDTTVQGGIAYTYAVAADGKRFLMSTFSERSDVPIAVILNRSSR